MSIIKLNLIGNMGQNPTPRPYQHNGRCNKA